MRYNIKLMCIDSGNNEQLKVDVSGEILKEDSHIKQEINKVLDTASDVLNVANKKESVKAEIPKDISGIDAKELEASAIKDVDESIKNNNPTEMKDDSHILKTKSESEYWHLENTIPDHQLLGIKTMDLHWLYDVTDDTQMRVSLFNEFIKQHNKIIVVDKALSHVSDRNQAHYDRLYEERFTDRLRVFKDLYPVYFDKIDMITNDLKPLDSHKITLLHQSARFSSSLNTSSTHHALLRSNNLMGKAIHGLSHGCLDLLYFIEPDPKFANRDWRIIIQRNETASSSSNLLRIDIKNDAGKFERFDEWVFLEDNPIYRSPYKILYMDDEHTGFETTQWQNLKDKITGTSLSTTMFDVIYAKEHETLQTAYGQIGGSTSEVKSINRMIKLQTSNPVRTSQLLNNRNLIDNLYSLQFIKMMEKEGRNVETDIASFIYSQVCLFIKSQSEFDQDDSIMKLDLEIAFSNVNTVDRIVEYKNCVNNGHFIPVSTLQWLLYFDKIKIEDWREFIIASTWSSPMHTGSLKQLMPLINEESKRNIKMVARNKAYASPFSMTVHLDLSNIVKNESIEIDWWLIFCRELMIRSISRDTINKSIPLLTDGSYNYGDKKMFKIEMSYENPVFAVFGMREDKLDKMKHDFMLFELGLKHNEKGVIINGVLKGLRRKVRYSDMLSVLFYMRFINIPK